MSLIEKTMPPEQRCYLITEYPCGEEVPVCIDVFGDDWDANFLAHLVGVNVIWMLIMAPCQNFQVLETL